VLHREKILARRSTTDGEEKKKLGGNWVAMAVATLYSAINLEGNKAWRDVTKESSDAVVIWC
jgi:hypothetical protein